MFHYIICRTGLKPIGPPRLLSASKKNQRTAGFAENST